MKKKQSAFLYFLSKCRNKYVITFLCFVVWIAFFDKNDFITTSSYRKRLKELQAEKKYYEEQIILNKIYLNQLKNNPDNLEKFAREKYFMKREKEEIFIIRVKNNS
ncbi:MAG: septum formation initiator family protein [Bacteroidetes bacterium]|mgnify:CR=1 FL=1|nr:MAG: septum formation initiator family protein [Bacteroidota bacterium]REK08111.1 MAG: septum formation initiator family protein [Bacteroidota bacterium]REK32316.1 MAG: septum formation initiator family protein [Bacteroidota bacterium]REK49550.1 MAG: septum formation initiator family protein [Bacteroidota bacterium]